MEVALKGVCGYLWQREIMKANLTRDCNHCPCQLQDTAHGTHLRNGLTITLCTSKVTIALVNSKIWR
ncbi:hypothetical protein DUNSADRAFT_3487 [Dunaliella salina]|uniref:Encoded protein n=1 Tax=Dunaliella salina TaxID=3046 RepID=A0ABQ7GTW5_DUNSA|nr:hypothetical protein DUNSADRAFT_3487 [Dunaliella salina]|eukprot:KAF5838053.1 hypothetical protein DUNSADRAFT_3487 [Dunaliella salina]